MQIAHHSHTEKFLYGTIPAALILLTGLFFLSISGFAQVSQPHRYERKQKNSDDYFNVISLQSEGIALYRERDKYKDGNRIWELVILDTALAEKKVIEIEVKERYKLTGYEVIPGNFYLLYRTGETTKSDFELIQIAVSGEEVARHQIKPDLDFRLTHFSKVGDNFAFGGYVNAEPAIFIYDLQSKLIKVVPGFFQKDTELVDLRANVNNTFNTVLIDRGTRGERKLTFKTFDPQGNLLLQDIVPIEENKTLQTGLTSSLEREDLVVLGNWGEKNGKQSKGFFSLRVDPFGDQKINYFNFGQLNHYLDFLNPKRAQRIKEESRKDAEEGKTPSYVNYVMPYRIRESKDGYLVLAEVYTPNTTTSPYFSNPYYYNPNFYGPPFGYGSMYRSSAYQPYPYNSGVRNTSIKTNSSAVVSFDATGKIRWDFSIKLNSHEVAGVEQVTDFNVINDKVYMVYRNESTLKIKVVKISDESAEDIEEKIKPLETGDEIRDETESEGGVRHWYDANFYVWGYQTVRNVNNPDRVRQVFYINKINAR